MATIPRLWAVAAGCKGTNPGLELRTHVPLSKSVDLPGLRFPTVKWGPGRSARGLLGPQRRDGGQSQAFLCPARCLHVLGGPDPHFSLATCTAAQCPLLRGAGPTLPDQGISCPPWRWQGWGRRSSAPTPAGLRVLGVCSPSPAPGIVGAGRGCWGCTTWPRGAPPACPSVPESPCPRTGSF